MNKAVLINYWDNPVKVTTLEDIFTSNQNRLTSTNNRPKVVVVIPAYNEERFIGSVVLKVGKYVDTVLVVDDGSNESTAEVAEAAGAIVVRHEKNMGKGVALKTGFLKARELNPDVVVTIDADGQHIPEEINQVITPVLNNEADIVVGSRYIENNSDVPRHRIIGHWIFNWITAFASGVFVTDSQSGYRAFSLRAIETLSFNSNGFSVESEMQFIAYENHLRLVEVPITIRYQDRPKRSVIGHGLTVLNGILQLVGQYRPLLFFGLPGFILTSVGLGWGLWVIEIYSNTNQLAIGYSMISVMLSIVGLVMLSTGIILHSVRALLIRLMET